MVSVSGCSESKNVSFDSLENKSLNVFVSNYDLHRQFDKTKLCSKSKKKLVSTSNYNFLHAKVAKLSEISNDNARRASKFVTSTSWSSTIDESIYQERGLAYRSLIERTTRSWLETKLGEFIDSKGKTFSKDDVSFGAADLSQEVAASAVKYCNLNTKYSDEYQELAARYNTLIQGVQSLADQVPWYPEGYSEWSGDPSLAWKWDRGSYCNLGDSCWHAKVISLAGCSGLYAEINIMDTSGNVIDYTNDLAGSLSPYSTAVLEFSTYNDYASTGRLTKLNCY
jgi:hypothetical protein